MHVEVADHAESVREPAKLGAEVSLAGSRQNRAESTQRGTNLPDRNPRLVNRLSRTCPGLRELVPQRTELLREVPIRKADHRRARVELRIARHRSGQSLDRRLRNTGKVRRAFRARHGAIRNVQGTEGYVHDGIRLPGQRLMHGPADRVSSARCGQ
jgi:hypothetical protein